MISTIYKNDQYHLQKYSLHYNSSTRPYPALFCNVLGLASPFAFSFYVKVAVIFQIQNLSTIT